MILSASSSIIGWQIGCVIILQCVQNCRMHVCNGYRSGGKNYIKVFMNHILLQYISHAFTQNLRPLKVENVTFLREAFINGSRLWRRNWDAKYSLKRFFA